MSKNKNWKRKAKRLQAVCEAMEGNCPKCPLCGGDSLCTEVYEKCGYTPFDMCLRSLEEMCKNTKADVKKNIPLPNMSLTPRGISEEAITREFEINELEDAIQLAVKRKEQILLYPKTMNLIVVDCYRAEQYYLMHTAIISYDSFNTEEEFINAVREEAEDRYGNKDTEV